MCLADQGLSEHLGSGWKGQFARTIRWHERVAALGARDDLGISPTTAFDYLYAFFQNCYHLRDWLKNAGAASDAELQAFMTGNHEMAICRDIANGTKHLRISAPSVDAKPSIRARVSPSGFAQQAPWHNRELFCLARR